MNPVSPSPHVMVLSLSHVNVKRKGTENGRGKSRDRGCNGEEDVSAMSKIRHPSLQDEWSSLTLASWKGHAEIVRILVSAGAHINDQDKVSSTSPAQ